MAKASGYAPFLKLKANEVAALKELDGRVKARITPFFDLPRKSEGMSEPQLRDMIVKSARKLALNLGTDYPFYLDNFDLPDALRIDGEVSYRFVIEAFRETSFIPVIGLDRHPSHIAAVFEGKSSRLIRSDGLALRLLEDDFQSHPLVEDELVDLIDSAERTGFTSTDLVLDCRLCRNHSASELARVLGAFIDAVRRRHKFRRLIVTGSSVPASIGDVTRAQHKSDIHRVEIEVLAGILSTGVRDVVAGDYTIVSPLYSEVSMPREMLLNVTAPKVLYSHDSVHYVSRGGALRTHHRGNQQYDDIAAEIVGKPFFRGASYSFGDGFLHQRARGPRVKMVTPGSILKPTINAHITYMATDHPLVA